MHKEFESKAAYKEGGGASIGGNRLPGTSVVDAGRCRRLGLYRHHTLLHLSGQAGVEMLLLCQLVCEPLHFQILRLDHHGLQGGRH